MTGPPYTVREHVLVHQARAALEGTYTCLTYERASFELKGEVRNNLVLGTYQVPGRFSTDGIGVFQLLAGRNFEWLEGYCSWLDFDSGRIESSKNVWIRPNMRYSGIYRSQVERLMTKEQAVFRARARNHAL